eukprot:8506735-Pyramimonas_sp.AAC.1
MSSGSRSPREASRGPKPLDRAKIIANRQSIFGCATFTASVKFAQLVQAPESTVGQPCGSLSAGNNTRGL